MGANGTDMVQPVAMDVWMCGQADVVMSILSQLTTDLQA